ncbi:MULTISPECIES: LuxR C-terminal-related transcriptional regulator [unclassified Fusibacter]|uniref:LuxR C-terminal-related transcriptional regulator n=1 Tax=unclassified Fusibacter TaxID=2624464 RepID=UPI001011570D|nr:MULTISPECIES: LuxR C-terminal-related transcriptional regulator [unclassified Fusibacter]MCK8060918.1 LuxR C-terminal-related transcriptional regulator [Fusibacter sp. A2]NPE23214.1 hypothetical protein [Fusibacter sp. A1]RXV59570.1 hypothetical protein DWB64_15390 [Fusibacter sp. A1]
MNLPILSSKLNKPQLMGPVVTRKAIQTKLNDDKGKRLILVSAPAGSGKSTVINEWISVNRLEHIWYSLDEWDNDLQLFFAYLITGIERIDTAIGAELKQLQEGFQSIGFEPFLRSMIGLLHQIRTEYVLVLDDYHLIENTQIDTVLKMLVDHTPQTMRLVVVTREDPQLSISKLRVKGQLKEIRISDLKFNEEEVKDFLEGQLKVQVTGESIRLLTVRTEGWVAGLQLAALSMQGHDNIDAFIEEFSGNHFYIMDYLIEEVLVALSPQIKDFLLKTSILDYFCGGLCDALLNSNHGTSQKIIHEIEQANLFIIPLDQDRGWFRYHHLFRDLIHQKLTESAQEHTDGPVTEIHKKAADWFTSNGYEREGIHHYLKASAFDEAAGLIENAWDEMDVNLQAASWLSMAELLPEDVIRKRPVLAVGYAWSLLDTGDLENSVKWLEIGECLYKEYLSVGNEYGLLVSDLKQFELIPANLASAHGYIAAGTGDIENLFRHAGDALAKTPEHAYYKRGVIATLLGFAHWSIGEFEEAERIIAGARKDVEKQVNPLTVNSFSMVLGELYIQQGRLNEAENLFASTIRRVEQEGQAGILLASLYLGLAKVAFLRADHKVAHELLAKSKAHSAKYAFMDWEYKYYLLLSRIYCSEGLYEMALDAVSEGKKHYYMNPIPDRITLEDMEVMIAIEQGRSSTANHAISEMNFNEGVPVLLETSACLYMKYHLSPLSPEPSSKKLDELSALCQTMLASAQKQGRSGQVVEYGVIKSVIVKRQGKTEEAKRLMAKAVELAKLEKYYRPFIDYLSEKEYKCIVTTDLVSSEKELANQRLTEPLTVRELEVLALIVDGLSNQEISDRLFLALSTVKGYIHNIYGKLSVTRRTEAVQVSRNLGLI